MTGIVARCYSDKFIVAITGASYSAGDAMALHRALGLGPWELSPLDDECPYREDVAAAETWPKIQEMRAELKAAA